MSDTTQSTELFWTRWHVEHVCWYFIVNPDKSTANGSAPFQWIDLRSANLRSANLRSANLTDADLTGANLTGADLTGANLPGADLTGADLTGADLTGADLRSADLRSANLTGANLTDADLRSANLPGANLRSADLTGADLTGADLRSADLRSANLTGANLTDADLRSANLTGANLSRTTGVLSAIEYLEANFEKSNDGYIGYKTFGHYYVPNPNWKIESGSVLTEVVNLDRGADCGCGVNVAKQDWTDFGPGPLWKVLIRWQWLAGVVVPFSTDGKIRCERVELIEIV